MTTRPTRRPPPRPPLRPLRRGSSATAAASPRTAAAFTLTEILIALALVAFLLVGISRIFAITSQTISGGQALSSAVRLQRAIQSTFSMDVFGPNLAFGTTEKPTGMMPLNVANDPDAGMPFMTISNFRVAAYATPEDLRGDAIAPADTTTMNSTTFINRSRAIRGTDLNADGLENATSVAAVGGAGETIPLYSYGVRNFRCDTVAFFTNGDFQSQTGAPAYLGGGSASFQGALRSNESYVWYGHMRVFNGEAARLDFSNANGMPGDWLTPSTPQLPNRNQRFASQFILGRTQMLLAEPTDHDNLVGTGTAAANREKLAEDNTIVANEDPSAPVIFVQRNWWNPEFVPTNSRPTMQPFSTVDSVVFFRRTGSGAAGANLTLFTDDRVTGDPLKVSTISVQQQHGRTDVVGVGAEQARRRARYLEDYDAKIDPPSGNEQEWWEYLATGWQRRGWLNPFVTTTPYDRTQSNYTAKSMAQRQQMLAESCTQFIVEFAGDFVTQDTSNGTNFGRVTAVAPDGDVDFVALPNERRETRWYGMPRDVDNNNSISTVAATMRTSRDVLPVRDFAGRTLPYPSLDPTYSVSFDPSFERRLPPKATDYALVVNEPTGAEDGDDTAYVCAWGPAEFERRYPDPAGAALPPISGALPTMIRFIVDVKDPQQRLQEPVTTEMIYAIPQSRN